MSPQGLTWSSYCNHCPYFYLSLVSFPSLYALCSLACYNSTLHGLVPPILAPLTPYSELSPTGLHWVVCLCLYSKDMQILEHPTLLCMLATAQWWPAGVESILFSACWATHPQDSLDFHQRPGCPLSHGCIHPSSFWTCSKEPSMQHGFTSFLRAGPLVSPIPSS